MQHPLLRGRRSESVPAWWIHGPGNVSLSNRRRAVQEGFPEPRAAEALVRLDARRFQCTKPHKSRLLSDGISYRHELWYVELRCDRRTPLSAWCRGQLVISDGRGGGLSARRPAVRYARGTPTARMH